MSGSRDQAKHYCDRANECMHIMATSQTPGTGETLRLIAEHYLLLAASEIKNRVSLRFTERPNECIDV